MELVSGSVLAFGQESVSRNLPSTLGSSEHGAGRAVWRTAVGGDLGFVSPLPNTEAWLEKAKL